MTKDNELPGSELYSMPPLPQVVLASNSHQSTSKASVPPLPPSTQKLYPQRIIFLPKPLSGSHEVRLGVANPAADKFRAISNRFPLLRDTSLETHDHIRCGGLAGS